MAADADRSSDSEAAARGGPSPGAGHLAFITAWLLIAVLLAVSFWFDLVATQHGGAVDFRNRITGARLLAYGIDPYHFLWHPGDPPEYCDIRNNPRMTVSKTTVTPTFLTLYLPLATLPYRAAQYLWLVVQWALLLGTLGLWIRGAGKRGSALAMALFTTGVTYTAAWRWEAERGQCYTLVLFLFAWWLTRTRNEPARGGFASGVLAGLLMALRPPFLMLAPFVALHRRGQLGGMATGLLIGLFVPLLMHPAIWNEYAAAMQTNSDYYRHANLPPRPDQAFPEVIEGTPTRLLGSMAGFPFLDLTVYALGRRLGEAPFAVGAVGAVTALLFALWLWLTRRDGAERLLPGSAAWLFLADFVLPTTRWGYYDVLILNVILAGIGLAGRLPWAAWPGVLALPVAWWLQTVPHPSLLILGAPTSLLAVTAVLFLWPAPAPGRPNILACKSAAPG